MKIVKHAAEQVRVPAAEWVRRLAEETAAFEIARVVERKPRRAVQKTMEWEVITLSVGSEQRQVDLFVQTRQHLLPNTVLGIFEKLKANRPHGAPLLCAPYISPRVAEMCREQSVSYLDGVGNCWISAPGLFVNIAGRPNHPGVRTVVDPFSKKSSRIVRTLLAHPARGWQLQQLAQQADVSLGLASKAKAALLENAYVEERDRLLFVRDGVKLLQEWSAAYQPKVRRVPLFAVPRPHEIESALAQWCRANQVTYALTQLAAAWRYAPTVRYDQSVAYLDSELETGSRLRSLLQHLDAREVETGANCALWITDDSAVFNESREFDGVMVVSPLQLYLDLMSLPGRGRDAAQEVFEKELRPLLATAESNAGGDP